MKDWRSVFSKEVVAICLTAFLADIACGILLTTFSLYARSLGATLTLIGSLVGVMGLTRILASVPIGLICDSLGRKMVISAGLLAFVISSFLHTIAPNPYFLFPLRILDGLGIAAVFFMGVAYIGDVVAKPNRGLVIGVYTTCMGLGFTLGPLLGGWVAELHGFRASYQVALVAALLGLVLARVGLVKRTAAPGAPPRTPGGSVFSRLKLVVLEPQLLMNSLANLLMSMVLFGAVYTFFPLYAASLSLGEAAIGSLLAGRALASTFARLPTGLLTAKFSSATIALVALALAMLAAISISFTQVVLLLGVFLMIDGIAYGVFITASQAAMTEFSSPAERGTAMGVYSTAGSIGGAVAPFIFGVIADVWGLTAVFRVTGILVLIGICLLWYAGLRQRRAAMLVREGRPA